jgi:hypothetical protein
MFPRLPAVYGLPYMQSPGCSSRTQHFMRRMPDEVLVTGRTCSFLLGPLQGQPREENGSQIRQACRRALQRLGCFSGWTRAVVPAFVGTRGVCGPVEGQLQNFQNLIVWAQIDAVPRMAREQFGVSTGKIDACPNLRTRSFVAKRASAICFLEEINKCELDQR